MKCGIDVGSTLIKAVTKHGNGFMYRSTANVTKKQLIDSLVEDGVDEVLATGIGTYDLPLRHSDTRNAHPLSEIQMQVAGTKELMLREGMPLMEYCLVSMGTGISYTSVENFEHFHLPVGNPIGGGYLIGMSKLLLAGKAACNDSKAIFESLDSNALDYMDNVCLQYSGPDLLYKDISKEGNGNIAGEMVIACCAQLAQHSSIETICFSLLNTVAIGIIKDLMMYKGSDSYKSNDIVCIGNVSKSEALQKLLSKYGSTLGLKFHFPMWGEYAGALGALLKLEKKALIK